MDRVEVRKVDVLFDDVFKVVEAEVRYRRPDGTMSEVTRRLSFERGDSAAAVIVDTDRQAAVLTEQFRYPANATNDAFLLEVAAGSMREDETPEECIRREIEEELGLRVPVFTWISTFYVSPGGSSERIHLYHAQVDASARVGKGGGVPGEDIKIVEVPLLEIPGLLADGRIVDAKTLIGLTWLVDNRLKAGSPG